LKKTYTKTGKTCRVTFTLPKEIAASKIALCGDFNEWNRSKHILKKRKNGNHSLTVSLETDHEYRFRYLLDGKRWENDWEADRYAKNSFGTEDSIVVV